jgi:hypothetical protein
MKNLKTILAAVILFIGIQSFAQSWQGYYQTKYGDLFLIEESGPEYTNGSLVYGDYRENGTMVGNLTQQDSGFKGKFFNGSSVGSFNLRASISSGLDTGLYSFNGTWGYNNEFNIGTTDNNYFWTGNRMGIKRSTGLKNALWSGKWNTGFGYLILEQVGDKVTGKYDTKGTIHAVYDKNSGTLEGTFTNSGQTGYFKFKIPAIGTSGDRNFFKGTWGWTKALEKGAWNGEKVVKTNLITEVYKKR